MPHPSAQLPDCAEDMYTCIDNPARFRVALAAAERLINIYRHKREDIKLESLQTTAHHFEVRKKDVYELLWGEKYTNVKTEVKSEPPTETEAPAAKKAKVEHIPKSARCIVTTLLQPSSTKDRAEAGASK